MIIARATMDNSKDQILVLGLSHLNVTRLLNSEPIRVRRATHGEGVPEGWEILIVCGRDEETMAAEFERAGVIGPETKIHRAPPL